MQTGVEVLRKSIGAGSDQIGCDTPEEGEPVGPMSFALAADETIHVLDQVNARVQVYRNNSLLRSLPLPSQDAVDIDVTSSDSVLVLDNLLDKALYVIDGTNGAVLQKIDLEGRNIAYAPAVTGVFFRPSGEYAGIWAEIDERAVRLAKPDGTVDTSRISVPGLPSAKGDKLVRASIIGDVTVMVYRSTEKFSEWDGYSVIFDAPVAHLLALAVDQGENVYLGVFLSDDEVTQEHGGQVELRRQGSEENRHSGPAAGGRHLQLGAYRRPGTSLPDDYRSQRCGYKEVRTMTRLRISVFMELLMIFASSALAGGNDPITREEILTRARAGVGFSYWWGHGRWNWHGTDRGTCRGNCPRCTHTGNYGADCSGYVAKCWDVGAEMTSS